MSERVVVRVGGIPADVTQEQFSRWFLFAVGFEAAVVSIGASGALEGAATFAGRQAAEWAVKVLHGRQLESQAAGGVVQLRAELQVDAAAGSVDGAGPAEARCQEERVGVIRFREASAALVALDCLNGTRLKDTTVYLKFDPQRADQTQLVMANVGAGTSASDLREYFSAAGDVVDADVVVRRTSGNMLIQNLSPLVSHQELQAALGRMDGFLELGYEPPLWGQAVGQAPRARAIVRFASAEACAKAMEILRQSAFPSTPSEPIDCDFLLNGAAAPAAAAAAQLRPDAAHGALEPPAAVAGVPAAVAAPTSNAAAAVAAAAAAAAAAAVAAAAPLPPPPPPPPAPAAPAVAGAAQRCSGNLLAVSGLPAGCAEQEVALFLRQAFCGFVWLKLVRNPQVAMAHVKFATADQAATAMQLMTVGGVTLPGHHSLLQVEYALEGSGQGVESSILIHHNGEPRLLRWGSKEQAIAELVQLGMLEQSVAISLLAVEEEDAKEIVSSLGPEVREPSTFVKLALTLRMSM